MRERIRIGISTCPNDTFAFAPLVAGASDDHGVDFDFQFLDIDELNRSQCRFDVFKASFHAALHLTETTEVLPSGAALGFGVGPLLLASQEGIHAQRLREGKLLEKNCRFLAPGEWTTATMLLKLFHHRQFSGARSASGGSSRSGETPGAEGSLSGSRLEQVVFSAIMPALQRAEADFGVCIHEGRFTWQEQGLALVEDLGVRWERETGLPLPLGGILVNRSLSPQTRARIQSAVRESIECSLQNPGAALPLMRKHAQEFSDQVLQEHVRLYVNQQTLHLDQTGRAALAELHRRAVKASLIPSQMAPLQVGDDSTVAR